MIEDRHGPRRIGRSVLALMAGFAVAIVLSLSTDLGLHAAGMTPALGQIISGKLLLLAAAYRCLYGIVSGYVVARLAPYRPLEHALLGGAIGVMLSTAGAVATWNAGLGPHWYPISLIVTALPTAWLGGKVCTMQLSRQTAR